MPSRLEQVLGALGPLWLACAVSIAACRDEAPPAPSGAPTSTPARPRLTTPDDVVLDVRADDPALIAARARARSEIDAVMARHARAPLHELSVKAPITDGVRVEQVWLAGVRYEDGVFIGTIDNDPERVKTRRAGEVVRVKKEDISDFMYEEDGKIRGNYTLRALLDRLPPEEAERYRAILAPDE